MVATRKIPIKCYTKRNEKGIISLQKINKTQRNAVNEKKEQNSYKTYRKKWQQ